MAPWDDHWIVRFIRERTGIYVDSGNRHTEEHKFDDLINTFLPSKVFLRHAYAYGDEDSSSSSSSSSMSPVLPTWRSQSRIKTRYAALVLCLNIGVDPPHVINVSPCARMECWIDPLSMGAGEALKEIGAVLSSQYKQLQSNAHYKLLLDPTMDDVRRLCNTCRLHARNERVLFHYNGHGVPKPTVNGEIWVLNRAFTQYIPLPIHDLNSWLDTPSIYVFDCSAAGVILQAFIELYDGNPSSSEKDFIFLAACEAHETLPQSDEFPADIFTSCLTTPIKMALRWLCSRSLFGDALDCSLVDKIPGCTNDRRTVLGELNWIFTAVTDIIAWDVLPHDLFRKLFRKDFLVANLFRNFLLAERILRYANCSPVTYPSLPPTHHHSMWDAWDMVAEICFFSFVKEPEAEFQPSSFFDDQLTAFETWLNHRSVYKKAPEKLPVILWALPSRYHQSRALDLLNRFLDLGPWAVNMALSVGIFPYILKLLRISSAEATQTLICIWTKILIFDKVDLMKDGAHLYFIKYLDNPEAYPELQIMTAFNLTIIMNGSKRGREACLSGDLMHACLRHLQANNIETDPSFIQWLCLCLGKLWEDHSEARLLGLQADASKLLAPLLLVGQPEVRAAATFAMGNLLDGVTSLVIDGAEMDMILGLLTLVKDGSPLVRYEVSLALARFAYAHKECMKSVAVSTKLSNTDIGVGQAVDGCGGFNRSGGQVDYRQLDTNYGSEGKPGMFSSSAKEGVLHVPESGDSSLSSNSEIWQDPNAIVQLSCSGNKVLDCRLCYNCVASFHCLARDPLSHVSDVGKKIVELIGLDALSTNAGPEHRRIRHASSWFEPNEGYFSLQMSTSSGTPQGHIAGLRRALSGPHLGNIQRGLADPVLSLDQSGSTVESSLLPHSSIYAWSLHHFSKPYLDPIEDEEDCSTRREDREKYAVNCITKWRNMSISKPSKQIFRWDTKFESGVKTSLLEPFSPVIVAADETEQIRIWNYRDDALLNCFDNSNFSVKGVSKFCLLNELDESLLLIASCDGNIRIWKDYAVMGRQKLVTAFSSLCSYGPRIQNLNALVDWQQLSGCLYATGKIPFIVPWDMGKEQCLSSIPSSSESGTSALSASQVHGGQLAAGFEDGSVRLYDIRTPELNVWTSLPDMKKVGRVIGVGFQPGLDASKIVSATQNGSLRFIDMRNCCEPYISLDIYNSSLTSLATHRHAPVVATNCATQPTKVFDLNGKQLVSIKHHQCLKPKWVGSVSCLAFHPYEVMLAAGTTDAFVSIYGE